MQEKTSQSAREGQTATGDDVGQPGGAYAKGNKAHECLVTSLVLESEPGEQPEAEHRARLPGAGLSRSRGRINKEVQCGGQCSRNVIIQGDKHVATLSSSSTRDKYLKTLCMHGECLFYLLVK